MVRYAGVNAPGPGSLVDLQHPLGNGCVGCWWPNAAVDAGRGLWIPDLSGNGRHALMNNGATWQVGSAGNWAVGLNVGAETNQYLEVTWPSGYDPQYFTIVVKINLVNSDRGSIINSGHIQWFILDSNNYFRVDAEGFVFADSGWATGKWQQHTIAVGAADSQWYIDGVLKKTATKAMEPLWGASLIIGRMISDIRLQGSIDHIALYARTFAPEEVAWLYREPAAMIWEPGRKSFFYCKSSSVFRQHYVQPVRTGPKMNSWG
jgi:hypothetical protein